MEKIIDEQLKKEFGFDLYGRYAIIRDIIEKNRSNGEIFRVLDVGGRGNFMKKFLPNDDVYYLDPFVESDDKNFIKGDGCAMPLDDLSFDWVTSADVFEHIQKEKRENFLKENMRVAGLGVILSAPFQSKEIARAEINANDNYKILSGGKDHIWLKEHIANGLPKTELIENFAKSEGYNFQKIHNNILYLWELFIGISLNVIESKLEDIKPYYQEFNYFYNTNIFPFDSSDESSYRKIFFIKKNKKLVNVEENKDKLNEILILDLLKKGIDLINLVNIKSREVIVAREEGIKDKEIQQKDQEILNLAQTIQQKDQALEYKEHELQQQYFEINTIKNSLQWKIPNFFYRFYINNIQKRVPQPIFRTIDFLITLTKKITSPIKKKYEIRQLKAISFRKANNPEISIIIPVFNKWEFTYSCLASLKENIERELAYEIIIVDNASSDRTPIIIKNKFKNIHYLRNKKNLGFVGGCNLGASHSHGKYIVFLNNDTIIKKNWLESLLNTFKNNQNIGLVGSKLVYPDGRLQEAGGIVWKNKNAWNYGRYKNPDDSEFNYLKDVDYCSGASIMLPKKIFDELNGFDELYAPAYYEDTDLAFRVRKAGFRTVYQPKSELIHFEGITAGTDTGKGLKQYQEINKVKFFSRWKDVLEKENLNDYDDNAPFLGRDRSKNKKIILYIDHNVPTYDKDAGSFIAYEYLKILKNLDYKVIFWPHNQAKLEPYTENLQQLGIEVIYGGTLFFDYMQKNGKHLDVVLVSRPHVAKDFMDIIKNNSAAKVIYIPHDLHYLRETRASEFSSNKKQALQETEKIKSAEEIAMKKADISLFFSNKEVEIVNHEFPDVSIDVIPWIQKIENDTPANFKNRKEIIFIGGYAHQPNVDAVKWFRNEIFPKVVAKISDIRVTFYGSNPPKEITDLDSDNFRIAGFIEEKDVKKIFDSAKIFVAPLRFGAGFKGKIAKSMSNGLPVITTSIGAEGIGLIDEETALIADNANDFAEKIIKLYNNDILWEKISKKSIKHIRENFSVQNAKEKMKQFL